MVNPKETKEQLDIAERLQLFWLQRMERLFESEEITSSDMNVLARVLMASGWTLDPSRISDNLKDKLKNLPEEIPFDEDEYDVPKLVKEA